MKLLTFYATLFVLFTFSFFSCTKKTDSKPIETCDTSNLNFNTHISSILKSNCISCHSKALSDSTGIMNLESYQVVKLYLDNDYHADGIYGSKLIHIINHNGSVPDMPPSYLMSACEIAKIQAWIKRNAPEN